MAILMKANGDVDQITEDLTLEAMQRLVGGYVEFVYLDSCLLCGNVPVAGRVTMVLDEEGRLKNKPLNLAATYAYQKDVIVGDVIVCVCVDVGLPSERYL